MILGLSERGFRRLPLAIHPQTQAGQQDDGGRGWQIQRVRRTGVAGAATWPDSDSSFNSSSAILMLSMCWNRRTRSLRRQLCGDLAGSGRAGATQRWSNSFHVRRNLAEYERRYFDIGGPIHSGETLYHSICTVKLR